LINTRGLVAAQEDSSSGSTRGFVQEELVAAVSTGARGRVWRSASLLFIVARHLKRAGIKELAAIRLDTPRQRSSPFAAPDRVAPESSLPHQIARRCTRELIAAPRPHRTNSMPHKRAYRRIRSFVAIPKGSSSH